MDRQYGRERRFSAGYELVAGHAGDVNLAMRRDQCWELCSSWDWRTDSRPGRKADRPVKVKQSKKCIFLMFYYGM